MITSKSTTLWIVDYRRQTMTRRKPSREQRMLARQIEDKRLNGKNAKQSFFMVHSEGITHALSSCNHRCHDNQDY
ncbi:hypothetical protein HDC33_001637 [Sporosarcina sp. JAI121]|nr:hypothetical protein [Sporosarcina sp. JAI121]